MEKLQYSPHQHVPIKFDLKTRQYAIETDQTALLDENSNKHVQHAVGCLLYYARAIDGTILPTLNTVGSDQADITQNTNTERIQLLDYVSIYQNAYLRFYSSDIDNNSAYLVLPKEV